MKIAHDYEKNGIIVKSTSIQDILIDLFSKIRPKRIIETGTYLGLGSTQMISIALEENNITDVEFYSIEVNPEYYEQAKKNVRKNVILINGLSVPFNHLPNKNIIKQETINIKEDFFIDHAIGQRVNLYYKETNFPDAKDDYLGKLIRIKQPDFVLLDSAGHIGTREFQYLISLLKKSCYIALDDINHIKHYANFEMAKRDNRFKIIYETKEKFGFGILQYRI